MTQSRHSKQVRASFFPPIALAPRAKSPTQRPMYRPMYRQLYDWFQRSIVSGQLRPGQRVPSTRSLAAELKVSRVPVLSAFEQLHAEGYLETFVGAGTCVARSIPEDTPRPAPGTARQPARQKISRKVSQRAHHLMSMQGDSDLKNIGAFRVSLPALDYFPVGVWSSLLSRHSRNSTREMMALRRSHGLRAIPRSNRRISRRIACRAMRRLANNRRPRFAIGPAGFRPRPAGFGRPCLDRRTRISRRSAGAHYGRRAGSCPFRSIAMAST